MEGCRVDCVGVITRSSVLSLMWVGKETCCWRLCEDKSERN